MIHRDERFLETYRFHALGPHPEEQAFAGAKACVSKDGRLHGRRLWPFFETRRLGDCSPRMRAGKDADMARTSETLV